MTTFEAVKDRLASHGLVGADAETAFAAYLRDLEGGTAHGADSIRVAIVLDGVSA